MLSASAQEKWRKIKAGEMVVAGFQTLDDMSDHFSKNDGPDADLYFREVASMPNPHRIGLYDTYVAFIYDRLPAAKKKIVDGFLSTAGTVRGNPDDDEDGFDLKDEMASGVTISDRPRGGYDVSAEGSRVGHYTEYQDALQAVAEQMAREKYYPNVFYVNDHGNVDLLSLKYRNKKDGSVGKVTDKIIRSWV